MTLPPYNRLVDDLIRRWLDQFRPDPADNEGIDPEKRKSFFRQCVNEHRLELVGILRAARYDLPPELTGAQLATVAAALLPKAAGQDDAIWQAIGLAAKAAGALNDARTHGPALEAWANFVEALPEDDDLVEAMAGASAYGPTFTEAEALAHLKKHFDVVLTPTIGKSQGTLRKRLADLKEALTPADEGKTTPRRAALLASLEDALANYRNRKERPLFSHAVIEALARQELGLGDYDRLPNSIYAPAHEQMRADREAARLLPAWHPKAEPRKD